MVVYCLERECTERECGLAACRKEMLPFALYGRGIQLCCLWKGNVALLVFGNGVRFCCLWKGNMTLLSVEWQCDLAVCGEGMWPLAI